MAAGSLVNRLRRNLADLLAPKEEAERPKRRRRPVAVPAPVSDFEHQLKALLLQSGSSALLSGRLNIIGLQKVKERFGAGWTHIADRVDTVARHTIERHLTQGDVYTSVGGLTYVTVFAHLSQEQAKVKCLAIADEIAKTLLGEKGGDLLEVRTAVKRVDGTVDLETVSLTGHLLGELSEGKGVDEIDFVERQDLAMVPIAARRAPPHFSQDLLANLRFFYRPFWDRGRNVVSTYLCAAQVLSSDGRTVLGDADALIEGDIDERARLDEKIRNHVLRDLAVLKHERRQLLLTLPVHFDTLGPVGRRRDFVAALGRQIAEGTGKNLLVEIAGMPAGVPESRLSELMTLLRRQCRGILLSLPYDTVDFTAAKACNAAAVGCDISGSLVPEATLMQHMNRFVRAAEKARVPSYLHGAKSLSRVVSAIGAGFNYIDGSAVASPIENPRGIVDFRLDDLYRTFMKS